MAVNTIAQTATPCKSFSGGKQYLEGFSQADYDLSRYDMSGQLRSALEKIIMAGTNAQAFSILSAVDIIDYIPGAGENFVPLNGFANYYGVSEEYLKGVLNRHKFLQKNYPDDVKRVCASDIARDEEIPLSKDIYWRVPGREDLMRYRLSDAHGAPCVSLPKNKSFLIYSPRIILATALSLLYTDKSGEKCTAKKVALAIKRSDYRVIAANPEKHTEPEAQTELERGIELCENGEIKMTVEVLDYIIRSTTREVVGLMSATNIKPTDEKIRKPDAWDDILAKWKYGKLTTHKAAKMAGLSVTSFRDYASGKKTFD